MAETDTEDERGLIEAAQGDPARFLELYDRHFHRVWAFTIRRAAHRAEAEDVVSETFRRALANIQSYEWRETPFLAWLLRIAANTLATRWQKAARESNEPVPDVAGADEDLERRALLYQLVERLPDAQRRVIELRYGEARSLAEVAEELGKSEGAVKQLQRRALEQLRTLYWEQDGGGKPWLDERMVWGSWDEAWAEEALGGAPRPEFEARLRRELERQVMAAAEARKGTQMTTEVTAVAGVREGFGTVTPYITVQPIQEFVKFAKEAFGAVETYQGRGSAGGFHFELRIGTSMLMPVGAASIQGRGSRRRSTLR